MFPTTRTGFTARVHDGGICARAGRVRRQSANGRSRLIVLYDAACDALATIATRGVAADVRDASPLAADRRQDPDRHDSSDQSHLEQRPVPHRARSDDLADALQRQRVRDLARLHRSSADDRYELGTKPYDPVAADDERRLPCGDDEVVIGP